MDGGTWYSRVALIAMMDSQHQLAKKAVYFYWIGLGAAHLSNYLLY
jgi:hypothetical protein